MQKYAHQVRKSMNKSYHDNYHLVTLERYSKSDSVIFSRRVFRAGHHIDVHWHDYNEIEIVLSGTARHISNGVESLLVPGSAYLMSSCDFHGIDVIEELTLLNLSFTSDSVDPILTGSFGYGVGNINCRFPGERLGHINDLFSRAIAEDGSRRFSGIMKRNLAEELIVTLLRESSGNFHDNISPLVHRAVMTVNGSFREPITLAKVADSLYVTPNHLGARFRKTLGISFNRYLNLARLRYACAMLTTSDTPIKEISRESGFESSEYFLTVFRKYLGMTPSEWRQSHS